MTTIEEIEKAVAELPPDQLARFRAWFDEFDAAQANFNPPQPKDLSEILAALEESVRPAEKYLAGMADSLASASWRLTMRGKELLASRGCRAALNHAKSLVSSSRPVVSLSSPAGFAGSCHLRPQC